MTAALRRPSLHTQAGINELADVCWEELTRFLNNDCCVIATRVFRDVMAQLGHHQVEPQPVQAYFYNEAAARHVREHRCLGVERACADMLRRADDHGVTIVLGTPRPGAPGPAVSLGDPWNGHLVAMVERRWLVDLSVSQASHPEHGVDLSRGTLVVDLGSSSKRWLRRQVGFWGRTDTGVTLCYQASTDTSYQDGYDWYSRADTYGLRAQITAATLARWRGEPPFSYSAELQAIRLLVGRV